MTRRGDMRGTHDDSMLQDTSPPPKITPAQARRAALFVAARARSLTDCRELLNALGLAPTTTPTGGTR